MSPLLIARRAALLGVARKAVRRGPREAPVMTAPRALAAFFCTAVLLRPDVRPANAADAFYSPAVTGIDTACNADRAKATGKNVVRIARFAAAGETLGAWQPATSADVERFGQQTNFATAELATAVFDRGAIVGADVAHADAATATVLARAWCFIGGKLSRATVDVTYLTLRDGYRRTRYYGDDLDVPLAEAMLQKGAQGKTYRAPPKDVDAVLTIDVVARPADLPFYDAVRASGGDRR